MAIPQQTQHEPTLSTQLTRAQVVWLVAAQVATLGLLALALAWARLPKPSFQLLLIVLAVLALVLAAAPRWRRGALAGVLGSVMLAVACMLSADRTLPPVPGIDSLITDYIPLLAPIVLVVALALAIWGSVVRAGLVDQARFGAAAVMGAVLIGVMLLVLLLILTYGVKMLNVMEDWQFAELASMTLLFAAALWVGGVGVRPSCRWTFLPIGMVIVLAAFLIYWQRMPR